MKKLTLVFLAILISGCASQRFEIRQNRNPSAVTAAPEPKLVPKWNVFYAPATANLNEVCNPLMPVAVEIQDNYLDDVWNVLTFGLLREKIARVYCE